MKKIDPEMPGGNMSKKQIGAIINMATMLRSGSSTLERQKLLAGAGIFGVAVKLRFEAGVTVPYGLISQAIESSETTFSGGTFSTFVFAYSIENKVHEAIGDAAERVARNGFQIQDIMVIR